MTRKQQNKITIYDIAKEAGVSASQVSRTISGKGYVSEQTREKILSLVEKYNYRPSVVARNLQQGKSNTVGILIPHIYQEYFPYVYSSFERHMTQKGYVTVVFNGKSSVQDEIRNIHLLEDIRVDAAVIIGGSMDYGDWEERSDYADAVKNLSRKIPCVLGNERAGKLECSGVYTDIDKGAGLVIEHLKKKGHKTLGILGGFRSVQPSFRLQESLKKQAALKGIEFRDEWQVFSSYNTGEGEMAMRTLLRRCKELPTAIACINDEIAVGAMGVALDAGLKIPDDIAFTGFDGVLLSQEFRPQLTTVQMDFETMGKALATLCENAIKGDSRIVDMPVSPWLEVRQST